MYPNMMNSIPFKKHKSKKPANNNEKPQADNNANDEKPKYLPKNLNIRDYELRQTIGKGSHSTYIFLFFDIFNNSIYTIM